MIDDAWLHENLNRSTIDMHCAVIVEQRIINHRWITLDLIGNSQSTISIEPVSNHTLNTSTDCGKSLGALGQNYDDKIEAEH